MARMFLVGLVVAAAVALVAPSPAAACPFCGGDVRSRLTLRMQFAQAKVVAQGNLKNPRFDPKTDEGSTELHVARVLKDDLARGGQDVIMLRTYLPVIGNTPSEFLVFCGVINGKLDPSFGVPCTPALLDYVKTASKLDDRDPAAKLGFFFQHLDSPDPLIAADSFFEFARATDLDIMAAAKRIDPERIRKLISNPATPAERIGVLAFVLGVCGRPADANFLAGMLHEKPLSERTSAAYGGLLAGYVLLDPKAGWPLTGAILGDQRQSFSVRLSAIGVVRYFQAAHGKACKTEVLRCCATLLAHGDLADQAIEDLRRWGYWDLTAEVLGLFGKPTHSAPIVRNSIVRYVLTCPDDNAKRFAAALRQSDPKLVQNVEESLALYAAPGK